MTLTLFVRQFNFLQLTIASCGQEIDDRSLVGSPEPIQGLLQDVGIVLGPGVEEGNDEALKVTAKVTLKVRNQISVEEFLVGHTNLVPLMVGSVSKDSGKLSIVRTKSLQGRSQGLSVDLSNEVNEGLHRGDVL